MANIGNGSMTAAALRLNRVETGHEDVSAMASSGSNAIAAHNDPAAIFPRMTLLNGPGAIDRYTVRPTDPIPVLIAPVRRAVRTRQKRETAHERKRTDQIK
jgi:hypothetical protein